jgi:hypothetical protein
MDLQLPVQSMPITTKVERSNPIHGEVYLIKQCDKVNCQLLATGMWFSPVSSTNTTVILLKVALNTINQPTH